MPRMINIESLRLTGTVAQVQAGLEGIKKRILGSGMVKIGPIEVVYVKEPPRPEAQRT